MNLIEESFQNKNTKKKDSKALITTIVVFMVIILILILGILGYLYYIKENKLVLTLDDQVNEKFKNAIVIEEDGTIYVPIKEVAGFFGYESYNGEYTEKSESLSKCYVQSENEVVNVTLGSEKLYKLDLTNGSNDYNYVYAKQHIKAINGALYGSADAIEKIFNVSFEYNKDNNTIKIYTTPYLVEFYSRRILDYGYAELSDRFVNQKAILDGVLIVSNEKNKYGAIDLDGNVILEAKYDDIQFLPYTKEFLVKSNGKTGVMTKTGQIRIDINYDEINVIDSDSELYIVKKDNRYGVMDFKGNTKIYIENDQIGVDLTQFAQNNIKNKYLLAENLIPVRREKYWGLFNKEGEQIVEFKYDSLGCVAKTRDGISLLVIPDYNVLVAEKDGKYTLVGTDGKELFDTIADSIYIEVSAGEKYYYIEANGNKINAIEFLEQKGIKTKSKSTDSEKEDDETENTNSTNSNSTNTTNTNSSSENSTNTTQESTNNGNTEQYDEEENNEQNQEEQTDNSNNTTNNDNDNEE